ncbi:MAG: CBS domain-containing protein [Cyclobacteriaceae bacterium]|nr:CBS domain-containing protein [Cyclobacteriaceae bacterium]
MELYLDSADLEEIKEAFKLGFIKGLTTTPTFMHRHGVTDIDGLIVELSKIVPVLQIEALGDTAEEVVAEAERQLALGLDKEKTVFKIPVSLEGVRACKMLKDKGFKVNVHLVYTLQQAYMAMEAGADYVCPLVGRLQDQGTDALDLVAQCVDAVETYGYDSKIMFSSVRYPEHIRNALNLGVHVCTIPWKVMKQLTSNHFTEVGISQFVEHTKLMTVKVKDVLSGKNPTVDLSAPITDALVKMTSSGFGCVAVLDGQKLVGTFTDGDLRRLIEAEGEHAVGKKMSDLNFKSPITIQGEALLHEASKVFHEKGVDNLVVLNGDEVVGQIDIQDLK